MCVRVCLCLYFALVFCIFCCVDCCCGVRFALPRRRIVFLASTRYLMVDVFSCLPLVVVYSAKKRPSRIRETAEAACNSSSSSNIKIPLIPKQIDTTVHIFEGVQLFFFFFNTYTPRSTLCTRAFACVGVCVTVCRCVWQLHFLAANVKFSLYLYSRVVVSSVAMWLSSVKNSIKQIIQVRREKSVTKMCVNILKRILCKEKNPATIMWHACLCYCCSP